ncbi:MAG: zinc-dependent alcohol dehydrogenase family protein [Candidatus Binatia bacterium]
MRAAWFEGLGGPSIMTLIDVPARDPGPDEVQLRVTSAGLNRADANYRRGRYLVKSPGKSRSGFEGAGIVTAIGSAVTTVRVGDRVAVLPSSFDVVHEGTCADSMTVPATGVVPTPANVSDADAGSIWMQCLTAWGALVEIAEIGPGDWVIVPAASSSVGIASIQLCRARGAKVIATTTAVDKVAALGRFEPDAIVDTRSEPYVERVHSITEGRGARVIFDPIYGPIVNDHIKVACREAIVFVYGALDSAPLNLGLGGMLRKQIRLQGYTLGPLLSDPARRARALREITDLLVSGAFTPVIDSYFPLDRIEDAHRHLESNRQIGKIVVTP